MSRNGKRGRGGGALLDDCNVDWCRCAGLVDFWFCHFDVNSISCGPQGVSEIVIETRKG